MRIRFTFFLLVANLAVFGLIWSNAHRRNREQPPAELVFPVNADHLTLSAAESPGDSYELRQKGGRWQLVSPYEWPANPWAVQKIIEELRFVSLDSGFTLEEAQRLGNTVASYGLDKPRFTLVVGADKLAATVKIGAMTPDGRAVYVLAPDGKTVLPVSQSLLAALLHKPDELRQPEVFSVQPFEVRAVSLTLAGKDQEKRIGLVRDKRERAGREPEFIWRFETPVSSDADTPVVEKELAALGELKFRRFLPGSPELLEKAGLTAPAVRLSLDGNNRRQTLLVGAVDPEEKTPHRYAKFDDNPAVFTIESAALDNWLAVRTTMREHRFLRFEPSDLTGVTVHSRELGIERSLVLHRLDTPASGGRPASGNGEWQMPLVPGSTATAVTPADPERIEALESALTGLTARDFNPPENLSPALLPLCDAFTTDEPSAEQLKTWGFETPLRKVELGFRDGKKRTLLIADRLDRNLPLHAKLAEEPTVYSIGPAVLDALSVRPEAYRRRLLFSMPAGARLNGIRITDLATGKAVFEEKKPEDIPAWETWLEKRPARERDEIFNLAKSCERLTADARGGFLSAPFSEGYRYEAGDGRAAEAWRYRIEWTITLPAGEGASHTETRTLYTTRRLGGTEQVAGSPADNAVFMLPQEWIDSLYPVTFGRDSSHDLPTLPTPEIPAAPDVKK